MSIWPEERVRDKVGATGSIEVPIGELLSEFGVRRADEAALSRLEERLREAGVSVEPSLHEAAGSDTVILFASAGPRPQAAVKATADLSPETRVYGSPSNRVGTDVEPEAAFSDEAAFGEDRSGKLWRVEELVYAYGFKRTTRRAKEKVEQRLGEEGFRVDPPLAHAPARSDVWVLPVAVDESPHESVSQSDVSSPQPSSPAGQRESSFEESAPMHEPAAPPEESGSPHEAEGQRYSSSTLAVAGTIISALGLVILLAAYLFGGDGGGSALLQIIRVVHLLAFGVACIAGVLAYYTGLRAGDAEKLRAGHISLGYVGVALLVYLLLLVFAGW